MTTAIWRNWICPHAGFAWTKAALSSAQQWSIAHESVSLVRRRKTPGNKAQQQMAALPRISHADRHHLPDGADADCGDPRAACADHRAQRLCWSEMATLPRRHRARPAPAQVRRPAVYLAVGSAVPLRH